MTDTIKSEKSKWPVWLMAWLAFIIILCGIITVCAPSIFWKFMDIILWFFLLTSGISLIINGFKNKGGQLVWLLLIWWFLLSLLWFMLIFSYSQVVWTIMIWMFALRALIRWITLVLFALTNKDKQHFRWAILWLWCLLFVLGIIIICVPKSESRTWAWVCIWISTIFDWVCLLVLSFKANDNSSLQDKLLEQADQNEIAQWNIDVNTSVQPAVSVPNDYNSSEINTVEEKSIGETQNLSESQEDKQ